MTDRLLQIAREAQSAREAQAPKARSAFDEAILAAVRDQAKINAQQFAARESAGGHLAAANLKVDASWWRAWPIWAGSGSFAAVIASVLLITGQPTDKTSPEQFKQSTANAPVVARAEVPAPIPAEAPAVVTAPATATAPTTASASVPAPASISSRATTASSPSAPNRGTVALEAPKVNSIVQADSALPASPPPAPMPAAAPAIAAAQSSGVAEASGLAKAKRAEVRAKPEFTAPQTVDQCASDIRSIALDRRIASDPVWFRLASYCKSTFPSAQWPADLGAINSTNIEPVKE